MNKRDHAREGLTEDIVDEVVVQGTFDWVNLTEVDSFVFQASKDRSVTLSEDARISTSLEVVRRVIFRGLMEPGYVRMEYQGFKAWDIEPDAAMTRIEDEWRSTNLTPGAVYGLSIWLAITPKGQAYGEGVTPKVEGIWQLRWPRREDDHGTVRPE